MSDYYSLTRNDVINLIEGDFPVILELGCSEGFTTEAAKRKFKSSVSYGVELSTQASEKAKTPIFLSSNYQRHSIMQIIFKKRNRFGIGRSE